MTKGATRLIRFITLIWSYRQVLTRSAGFFHQHFDLARPLMAGLLKRGNDELAEQMRYARHR